MMNILKKLMLSTVAIAMTILMVGCGNSNVETDNKKTNDDSNKPVENQQDLPIATIKIKNFGIIEAELYPNKAPNTVNNFIELANSKFYDGLTFHRIIKGFMNQGGDPEGTGMGGPGYSIKGEFSGNGYEANDLKHSKGVLSMARANDPDSAGSQFFIMAEDAPHLDTQYAAFGKVIDGLDIVEAINSVKTGRNDAPAEPVVIEEIRVDTKGVDYPEAEKIK